MSVNDTQDELMWVDANGVAHPLGEAATERMLDRGGAFRLMPSPGHVVFMRYVGEDGRRDIEDGAVVRLAGEITRPGTMCDVLAILGQSGWRGELLVYDGDSPRSIFFESGNVLGARTSIAEERIGQILFKYGAINQEELDTILLLVNRGKRFGASAVQLNILTQEQIYHYLRKQVEEIVCAAIRVSDGFFCFLEDFDDARLVSRQVINGGMLVMDLVARMDEMKFFRSRIPSAEHVPVRATDVGEPSAEFAAVWDLIDGERNIEDIGRESHLGEFKVTKNLYNLVQSRHVSIRPPKLRGGATAVIETANEALRTVHLEIDADGRGTQFRRVVRGFMEGTYDGLFSDAGPFEDGSFRPARVLRNAIRLAGAADLQNYLREMLYEFVSFVLFSAGAQLGPESERKLTREIEPLLYKIRPAGSSQSMLMTVDQVMGESLQFFDDDDETL